MTQLESGDAEPLWFAGAMERILTETLAPDIQVMKDDIQLESGDAEPLWFAGAMERILTETLAPDIQVIKDNIRDIERVQGDVWRLAAKTHNLSAGGGDYARLEVVPFRNGQDPTKDPHNLPPLTYIKDVRELNPQQCDKYYKGYYDTDQLPLVHERIEKIFLAIGANVF